MYNIASVTNFISLYIFSFQKHFITNLYNVIIHNTAFIVDFLSYATLLHLNFIYKHLLNIHIFLYIKNKEYLSAFINH